jgi:hypothetical protein
MNEQNNGFSLDVAAETQAMSSSLTSEEGQTIEFTVMEAVPLPETTFFSPTKVDIEQSITPEKAKIELNPELKVNAEEAYSKAEETEAKLEEVRGGVLDMYNEMKNSWIPNKNTDEFEERPTTEPQKLIFDARRERMSMPPKWA